ncbi:MAG: cell division protein FtsZ [Bryobacteraceae bacterium]
MKFEMAEDASPLTKIKVLGIGGGGSNAVARMMESGLTGVEYYVLNTDRQALMASPVPNKLAIGAKVTNGLGAGSDPAVGRQAALEDTERIVDILEGADMVFVTTCLGGGTGTGAAPVVASLAKELNALTVAVVTKPFRFEGPRRMKIAEHGLAELAGTVDTVITIPNSRLLEVAPAKIGYVEAFRMADDVLLQAVQGISEIITTPGLINRDFADIRAIMLGMGHAMMCTASAKGEKAAVEAARKAMANPLLEDGGGVRGAKGVLINISGSSTLPIQDVDEACSLIWEATENEDVHINYGMVLNENLGDEVKLTVIATGFERAGAETPQKVQVPVPARAAAAAASASAIPFPSETSPRVAEPVYRSEPSRPVVETIPEAEPEPMRAQYHAPIAEPDPTPQHAEAPRQDSPRPGARPEPAPANDLDTPAFLRRDRRLFQ